MLPAARCRHRRAATCRPSPPIAWFDAIVLLGDAERAGRVEDPAPLRRAPVRTVAAFAADRPPPSPSAPLVPFAPTATLFLICTEVSVTWPPACSGSRPLRRRQAVLDRHARDRHLPRQDLEDAVHVVAVDDRVGRALAFDRQIAA